MVISTKELESNIYVAAAVLGSVCGVIVLALLFIIVLHLRLRARFLNLEAMCIDSWNNSGQLRNMNANNQVPLREREVYQPQLSRQASSSMFGVRDQKFNYQTTTQPPITQTKPNQLRNYQHPETFLNIELKNQIMNRNREREHQESEWDQHQHQSVLDLPPGQGNRNITNRNNPVRDSVSSGLEQPYPVMQRTGSSTAATSFTANLQRVGY